MKKLSSAALAASMLLGMGTAFAQGYAGAMPQEYATGWKAKQALSHNPGTLAANSGRSDTDRTVALRAGDRAMSPSATLKSRD